MDSNASDVAWQEVTAMIIGRAYPEPSKKHSELSAKVRKAEMGDDSARTYFCEV
jgi:hypothetical protein